MRRFFAKNLLFVIAVNLLIKPVWIFLIDRTVQNKVGHASYGIYQALFNLGLVFQILLDFGINNYNSKTLAQYPGRLRTLFPAMLSARIVLSLFYFIIVAGIALVLGYRGTAVLLLMGVLLIQALNSIMLFVRSNMSGLHKFKADGLLSVTDRCLMIFICGALLFIPATSAAFTIEWFVLAQIASYGLAILIGIIVLKRLSDVGLRFSFDVLKVTAIVRQSLPYALLIFLMSVYTRADMMLVERLSGTEGREQAGIYAAAYRMLDVGNMFGLMMATMLLPIFGRQLAQKENVRPLVVLSVNMLIPASIVLSACCITFSAEIMHALYHHATDVDGIVFALLMASFPAFSISNIYSTLLTSSGSLRLLNKIAFAGVVLNLAMNFYLIPRYAAVGAATAAFATQAVLALAFVLSAWRATGLKKNPAWIAAFVIFTLLIAAAGYAARLLPGPWLWKFGALGLAGASLILLFRFVRIGAVKQFIGGGSDGG